MPTPERTSKRTAPSSPVSGYGWKPCPAATPKRPCATSRRRTGGGVSASSSDASISVRTVSRPVWSARANGPGLIPAPTAMAASMSRMPATPSSSRAQASARASSSAVLIGQTGRRRPRPGSRRARRRREPPPAPPRRTPRPAPSPPAAARTMRLTIRPGDSAQRTGCRRSACTKFAAVCAVTGEVSSPSTTSTSRVPARKCRPTTSSGRVVTSLSSVMPARALVAARIAWLGVRSSRSAKTSSVPDSRTRSADPRSPSSSSVNPAFATAAASASSPITPTRETNIDGRLLRRRTPVVFGLS